MTRPALAARLRDLQVLDDARDLAEDRVERVLQRAVDLVALRRPQFVEVLSHAARASAGRQPWPSCETAARPLALEHRLADDRQFSLVIVDRSRSCAAPPRSMSRQMASANSVVVAVPPRSRVGTVPSASTAARRRITASAALALADVAQHQEGRQQQRRRVGEVPAGDVGRRAVHRLEHRRRRRPCWRCRTTPEAADQPGAQVREDVAVEVRQQQHVELLGRHHQVHAGRVDDPLVVLDVGVVARPRCGRSRGTGRR